MDDTFVDLEKASSSFRVISSRLSLVFSFSKCVLIFEFLCVTFVISHSIFVPKTNTVSQLVLWTEDGLNSSCQYFLCCSLSFLELSLGCENSLRF